MSKEQSSLFYSDLAVFLTQLLENSVFVILPCDKYRLHYICQILYKFDFCDVSVLNDSSLENLLLQQN